ncbi:TPA: hypothetical protein N0F65_001947 [Lagenidium giganteum]|uniref:Ion transport domain-containing protein n=1 Tax=Lagenidium giganteum TaxID=4803 RepID=A0AAV2YTR4_9STRA|nr:TPA: hypothetical protein N0F65_001947 [Lagenidium giganteum]
MARAMLLVLLCLCGLEYLRMVPLTSLLISITFKMVNDVIKFVVLYGVFQIGFSGSFFLLFQSENSRYNTYGDAFLATFLMLFGDFDSDLFLRLTGAKAVISSFLVVLYLLGAMVMLLNLLIAMMSTSYQQVLDSAKVARSIARAETILRMENLLPHRVRVAMFNASFNATSQRDRVYAIHEGQRKQRNHGQQHVGVDAIKTDASKARVPGLAHSGMLPCEKEAEPRHASHATSNASDTQSTRRLTQTNDKRQPAVPKLRKRKQNHANRLTRVYDYVKGRRSPHLDDCLVIETVDGSESVQDDLRQVQAVLEARMDRIQEQIAKQLELLRHDVQKLEQRFEQQVWAVEERQEIQTKLEEI